MKKFIALVVASVLVAGVTTPSFAASPSDENNCVFKDKSLCKTESLVSYNK